MAGILKRYHEQYIDSLDFVTMKKHFIELVICIHTKNVVNVILI